MKAVCLREKFIHAVLKADKVTSKNPNLAVLSCILVGGAGDQLVIRATNLEMAVEVSIPAKIEKEGVMALPAGTILSFLTNIPSDKNVSFTLGDDKNLVVECGGHKAVIKTVPYEDFPHIPMTGDKEINLDIEEVKSGIRSVWYGASISGIKPELSSVYVFSEEGDLVFVGTDSFRLAEKKVKSKKNHGDVSLLVPQKNIADLLKIFEDVSGEVSLKFDSNHFSINTPNLSVISRLVNGNFPDYRKIIPKEHSTEVTVLKDDLIQSLRIMKVFSDKYNQISIAISGSRGTFEISSKNSDVGQGTYVFKSKVKGESLNLNFNHKYLFDCLQAIPEESVVMKFNGPGKALVVEGHNNSSFVYLVMPNR